MSQRCHACHCNKRIAAEILPLAQPSTPPMVQKLSMLLVFLRRIAKRHMFLTICIYINICMWVSWVISCVGLQPTIFCGARSYTPKRFHPTFLGIQPGFPKPIFLGRKHGFPKPFSNIGSNGFPNPSCVWTWISTPIDYTHGFPIPIIIMHFSFHLIKRKNTNLDFQTLPRDCITIMDFHTRGILNMDFQNPSAGWILARF